MSADPISIECRDQEQIILRADLSDAKTRAALKAMGLKAPRVRRREANDQSAVHWFSPDEALIFVPDVAEAMAAMKPKLPKAHLLHDATGARVVFTIKGDYLRDLLAKGTPRDVAALEMGEVVRTHLGQFAVAFWFLNENHVELVAFRSLQKALQNWLEVEAKADGLPVLQG